MTFDELTGMNHASTDATLFWETAVQKIGRDIIMAYAPFTLDILKKSYLENTSFNTSLTPLRAWDRACGAIIPKNYNPTAPIQFSGGLREAVARHTGITSASLSECVCLLKTAARMTVIKALTEPAFKATNILWDTDGETVKTLPKEVVVPAEVTAEYDPDDTDNIDAIADAVGDWLSDEYAYCHFGFGLERIRPEPEK